jgi:RNA polymerase sigma-70 factor (ECF subfamily)
MHESPPPTEADDMKLALRMAEKDESALRTVLESYGPKVKGYLSKQFGEVLDSGERDAVLNEAALKVWEAAHAYDAGKGGLRGWFVRIARNTAISHIRGEKRHRSTPLNEDPAVADGDVPPVVDPVDRARLERLDDFIHNKLTGIEKTVALNCFTVGGDADSVRLAAKLGKTRAYVDTVKSKVKRKIQEAVLSLEAKEITDDSRR